MFVSEGGGPWRELGFIDQTSLRPALEITDPDEAEALGLTVDAERMRRGTYYTAQLDFPITPWVYRTMFLFVGLKMSRWAYLKFSVRYYWLKFTGR